MALATTVPFRFFKVMLGDGATTEVFTAPCGLTSNGIAFTTDTNSTVTPDCTNPDLPGWVERDVVSHSATISGAGVMAEESLDTWWAAYNTDASINARVQVDRPAPTGGYWAGAFHVTRFEQTGTRGNRVAVTVALESTGAVAWVPAV